MSTSNHWYQNAVFYQLHVRCFFDANNDGIGDFTGLTKKLDHICALGCNVVWLQPFYPSPLLDDGYDIAEYYDVHPNYGSLKDFKRFLHEAHKRKLKVVTELVINHTSDQHSWFQRARRAKPGTKWRNFYMWSDDPTKFSDARIIFKDFERSNWSWDPIANAYYWHRFYSHQPDLNYDNPDVHKEIFKVLDFWMQMGVDGMRLDAIPYLYAREGTDCENLPETHNFLKDLRRHIDEKYPDRMLLAEANQWPNQAAAYFGEADECHMAFHFPVMPRLFMAIQMEDRFPVVDIMDQTPTPPEGCQWATFLRNHDELTLEMVTDEERDFMYRVYAKDPKSRINLGIRRRLAPLLGNDRRKIELLNILLFSLPGSPIVYYGDEIGMGDNYYLGDRNGVRTPMQWNSDRNSGFSDANPQRLYLPLIIDPEYHHDWLNVENQERTMASLLWWMRRTIAVRGQSEAFGRGSIHFLHPNNLKVLAFTREIDEEKILVIINLSSNSQYVEIDLEEHRGSLLRDMFSLNLFGKVRQSYNSFTLSAYGYFWLRIEKEEHVKKKGNVPSLEIQGEWENLLFGRESDYFYKKILPRYLMERRWFRSKAETIKKIELCDAIAVRSAHIVMVEVVYLNEKREYYVLPLSFLSEEDTGALAEKQPKAVIANIDCDGVKGALVDAIYDKRFRDALLELFVRKTKRKTSVGLLKAKATAGLIKRYREVEAYPSEVISVEQTNSSIIYQGLGFLKLYRRIEPGINPDHELIAHLSERKRFTRIPAYEGSLEWTYRTKETFTLALMQDAVKNEGDLWHYMLDAAKRYYTNVIFEQREKKLDLSDPPPLLNYQEVPEEIQNLIGWMVMQKAAILGARTAEMHMALASPSKNQDISPEPFTLFYQKSLYQAFRGQNKKVLSQLHALSSQLPEDIAPLIEQVKKYEKDLDKLILPLLDEKISSYKIRAHGDFHLGQVLVTGNDLVIIDFEGEPAIPLTERKLKRSALQDVAGMVRSFHYASLMALEEFKKTQGDENGVLSRYADYWYRYMAQTFLKAYFETIKSAHDPLIPKDDESLQLLFNAYLIKKVVYEIGYELQNRPDWIKIPLQGFVSVMEDLVCQKD